jgi:putative tricarboxylic transport membrane protein
VTIPKDSVAGFLLLALAAGYWWLTLAIPSSSLSDEVGADGLPKVLAATLGIVACLLIGKGRIAIRSPAQMKDDEEAAEHAPLPRALGFLAIGIGYMVVAPLTGFAVGIAALIVAVAVYEREHFSVKLLAVAVGAGIGFWLLFVRFLGTEQPFSALLAILTKS